MVLFLYLVHNILYVIINPNNKTLSDKIRENIIKIYGDGNESQEYLTRCKLSKLYYVFKISEKLNSTDILIAFLSSIKLRCKDSDTTTELLSSSIILFYIENKLYNVLLDILYYVSDLDELLKRKPENNIHFISNTNNTNEVLSNVLLVFKNISKNVFN